MALLSFKASGNRTTKQENNRMVKELAPVILLRLTIKLTRKRLNNSTIKTPNCNRSTSGAYGTLNKPKYTNQYNTNRKENSITELMGFVFPKMLEIIRGFTIFVR